MKIGKVLKSTCDSSFIKSREDIFRLSNHKSLDIRRIFWNLFKDIGLSARHHDHDKPVNQERILFRAWKSPAWFSTDLYFPDYVSAFSTFQGSHAQERLSHFLSDLNGTNMIFLHGQQLLCWMSILNFFIIIGLKILEITRANTLPLAWLKEKANEGRKRNSL